MTVLHELAHVATAISVWISAFVFLILFGISFGFIAIVIWLVHFLLLPFTGLLSPYNSEGIDERLKQYEDDCLEKYLKLPYRHLNESLKCGSIGIPMQLHTISVPSAKPGAPTIVLVHGTAGSSLSFVNVIEHLHKDFNVLVIDLPGFGRSQVDVSYGEIAKMYEDSADFHCAVLETFLDANKIHQTYLCGHSFGGYICTRFTLLHPQRVSGLVLINPAGLFPTLGGLGTYWACVFKFSLPNLGRYLGRVGFLLMTKYLRHSTESLYWYYLLGHPRGIGDLFVRDKITLSPLGAYWNSPIFDDLAKVGCPLLLVYGEEDSIMPPHQGMVIQRIHSRVALELIKSSGHSPMDNTTNAREVAKTVQRFLLVDQQDFIMDILLSHSNTSMSTALITPTMLLASAYKSSFSQSRTFATIARLYHDFGDRYGIKMLGIDAEQVEALRRRSRDEAV